MGRPRSVTDAMRDTILKAVSLGLGRGTAAKIAGTSTSTIARECERNAQFREQLQKAEAECESVAVQRIRNARAWQAAAWFLERKFPARWGRHRIYGPQSADQPRSLPGDKVQNEIQGDLSG